MAYDVRARQVELHGRNVAGGGGRVALAVLGYLLEHQEVVGEVVTGDGDVVRLSGCTLGCTLNCLNV